MKNTTPLIWLLPGALACIGALAQSTDVIRYAEPRPMMKIAGELVSRYHYLVTYEDAPDNSRDSIPEDRGNGRVFLYPRWKPVTFHLNARQESDPAPSGKSEAGAPVNRVPDRLAPVRPLGPDVIKPLIEEYNSSGNPGRFDVIFGGAYAHIVAIEHEAGGNPAPFEPILSTVVPVNQSEGTCYDLLSELFKEVQQIRGIPISIFEAPVLPMRPQNCSISGHVLPAREVLIQLLEETGHHERGVSAHFTWTLVYDPTTATYVFCTQGIQDEPLTVINRPVPTKNQAPGSGSRTTAPPPTKKQQQPPE